MIRHSARILTVLFLTVIFTPAVRAQETDVWSKRVTLSAQDETLSRVFSRVFTEAKAPYTITPEAESVTSAVKVSARMDLVPLKSVVESLARTAGRVKGKRLVARFEKDRCVIEAVEDIVKPAAGPPADRGPGGRLISYSGNDVTVLRALTDILEAGKIGYRIHPAVRIAMAAAK